MTFPVRGKRSGAALALVLSLLLVSGCAAPGNNAAGPLSDQAAVTDVSDLGLKVADPWQRWNRGVYNWNASVDRHVFIPIVDAYTVAVPEVLRNSIANFFTNIENIRTFANQILQLKFLQAGQTAVRFVFNTGMGLLGIADIATALDMPQYDEDFGQTLGYWGVGDEPYLVLPFFGPSNVRDAAGIATDTYGFAVVDPFGLYSLFLNRPPVLLLEVLDERYNQPFRYYSTGSPFEYEIVRLLYTQKRRQEVAQ